MNKNSIKDDELENVNGGTQWEIRRLQDALGTSDIPAPRHSRFHEMAPGI